MASKSLTKVRRTQKLCRDRLMTLDKQGREINYQDQIIERIEEFCTELYDNEQSTIIHTDPKEVLEITFRGMKEINTNSSMTVHQESKKINTSKRSTTGRNHIAQAVHSSTRKHIPTTNLGNQRHADRRLIS